LDFRYTFGEGLGFPKRKESKPKLDDGHMRDSRIVSVKLLAPELFFFLF